MKSKCFFNHSIPASKLPNVFELLIVAVIVSSCLKGGGLFKQVGQTNEAYSVTVSETAGVYSGAYDPTSAATQTFSVSSAALSGTSISIAAGTFSNAAAIQITEGATLASSTSASLINLGTSVSAAGPSVVISSSLNVDPGKKFSVTLPRTSAGLALSDSNIVVIYKAYSAKNNEYFLGVFGANDIKVSDSGVTFEAEYFGAYQVAIAEQPVLESKKVVTETKILTKSEEEKLPEVSWSDLAFEVDNEEREFTLTIKAKNLTKIKNCTIHVYDQANSTNWIDAKELSGVKFDSIVTSSGLQYIYETQNDSAHRLYARVGCVETSGRESSSSLSAAIDFDAVVVSPTPTDQPPAPKVPAALTSFVATAPTSSQISLIWNIGEVQDETGFKLAYKPGTAPSSCTDTSANPVTITGASTRTYQVSGLNDGTTYHFAICSFVDSTLSAVSSANQTTTIIAAQPVEFLKASEIGNTSIKLSWSAPSTGLPPTSYVVQRNSDAPQTTSNLHFEFSGLSPDTSYSFVVYSRRSLGGSSVDSSPSVVPATTFSVQSTGIQISDYYDVVSSSVMTSEGHIFAYVYRSSNQEVAIFRSTDFGKTWSDTSPAEFSLYNDPATNNQNQYRNGSFGISASATRNAQHLYAAPNGDVYALIAYGTANSDVKLNYFVYRANTDNWDSVEEISNNAVTEWSYRPKLSGDAQGNVFVIGNKETSTPSTKGVRVRTLAVNGGLSPFDTLSGSMDGLEPYTDLQLHNLQAGYLSVLWSSYSSGYQFNHTRLDYGSATKVFSSAVSVAAFVSAYRSAFVDGGITLASVASSIFKTRRLDTSNHTFLNTTGDGNPNRNLSNACSIISLNPIYVSSASDHKLQATLVCPNSVRALSYTPPGSSIGWASGTGDQVLSLSGKTVANFFGMQTFSHSAQLMGGTAWFELDTSPVPDQLKFFSSTTPGNTLKIRFP